MTEEVRDRHFDAKGHAFCTYIGTPCDYELTLESAVESREGYLYCQGCNDYVYDPILENIRLQKGQYHRLP